METHPFLKDFRSRIVYFGIWMLVAGIYYAIFSLNYPVKHLTAIADSLIHHALFALIALGLWYAVKYTNFERMPVFSFLINHLAGVIVALTLWLVVGFLLVSLITGIDYRDVLINSLPWRIIAGIFYYSIVVMLYYLIMYYQHFRESLVKESEMRALMKEAELSMLRSQINPHFLFNSLNSISSLTLADPGKAQEMIIKLSGFIRYSLGESERMMVPLRKELEYIQLYLDIEKVRFGDKLISSIESNEACLDMELPNMILQPLYENAVKHGVYESIDPVNISTRVTCNPGLLSIHLSNTFDPEVSSRKGKGLGLNNIRNRLKLLYGRDDLITINKTQSSFEVQLLIPQFLQVDI